MTVKTLEQGALSIIVMPRRLMMADAPQVRSQIQSLVARGSTRLVLDLQEVEMMDSSGLSTLVTALKEVEKVEGRVVLAAPSDDVRALIEITQLHQVFEIFDDQSAAVRSQSAEGAEDAAA